MHAQRCALYVCQSLENALFPRPTGLLTSMSSPEIPILTSYWPQHTPKQLPREYTGPLPLSCGCGGLCPCSRRQGVSLQKSISQARESMLCAFLSKIVSIKYFSPMMSALTVGKEYAPSLLLDPRSSGQSLGPLVQNLLCVEFNGQIKKVTVGKSVATLWTEFAEEDSESNSRTKCPSLQVFHQSRRACVSANNKSETKLVSLSREKVDGQRDHAPGVQAGSIVRLAGWPVSYAKLVTDDGELAQEDAVGQIHNDKDELEARAAHNLTIPERACLNEVRHHLYIGRGSRQRGLPPSQWSNLFSVTNYGRYEAIDWYQQYLNSDSTLKEKVDACLPLCKPNEHCHGDVLIAYFKQHIMPFSLEVSPPTSALLSLAADNRRTSKEDDSDTDADIEADLSMQVGSAYAILYRWGKGWNVAGSSMDQVFSPGHKPKSQRRFPQSDLLTELRWLFSTLLFSRTTNKAFSTLLCARCATSPCESSEVDELRVQVVDLVARHGHSGSRRPTDEPSPTSSSSVRYSKPVATQTGKCSTPVQRVCVSVLV